LAKVLTPGKVLGVTVLFLILLPTCTSLKNGNDATLTIQSDQEIPFEFTLAEGSGSQDSPLALDCMIRVQHGVGRFVTGSRENMNYYGSPPSYFTRFSRRVVVEIVDRHNEVVKRQITNARHTILFGLTNDPKALYRQRFFVRYQ
jgi:hypothetical protein